MVKALNNLSQGRVSVKSSQALLDTLSKSILLGAVEVAQGLKVLSAMPGSLLVPNGSLWLPKRMIVGVLRRVTEPQTTEQLRRQVPYKGSHLVAIPGVVLLRPRVEPKAQKCYSNEGGVPTRLPGTDFTSLPPRMQCSACCDSMQGRASSNTREVCSCCFRIQTPASL